MFSSFNSVHSSIAKNVKQNVVAVIDTTGLKIYLTFDYAVSSTGGTYSSGLVYIPNLALGANNTSDTTGSLFKASSATDVSLNTINKKWGTASLSINSSGQSFLRNLLSYTVPQNTGLTFSIWVNAIPTQFSILPLFGFSNSSGSNIIALRLKSKSGTTAPWTLNYLIDENNNTYTGVDVSPVQTINSSTWYNYAWVISPALYGASTTHTFYINGSQIATATAKYPVSDARIYNDIGTQAYSAGIGGYIDTFRYYERNLSSNEINTIYSISDPANSIGTFTPNSISGLKLWFDASDISGNGTNVTNGTLINKWFDKSGLNNHATANANITYNSTGLNSKSTMTFDSSTKYLTGNNSISGPYLAMFVIASIRNSPPAVSVAIAFSSGLEVVPYDNTAFTEFTLNSTTGLIPFRNVNAPPYQPNPLPYLPPTSTPTLFEAWFDGSFMYSTAQSGSNTTNYLTTKTASSGNFSSTFFCLGNSTAPSYGNAYFTGSISEILVYNPSSALAYNDIQKIEGYLSWKWGLQTNLPSTHTYYTAAP